MDCIYVAPLSKALYNFCLSFTHSHSVTFTFTHQRRLAAMQGTNQLPARWEKLGVRCLAQGHFDTPRVGSNRQPSDSQTTALAPEPHHPLWWGINVILLAYYLVAHPSLVQVYNFVPDVLRQLLCLAHGGNVGMRLIVWTGGFYTAT